MANQNLPRCECCGRPFPKAKAAKIVTDTTQLTDADLFAHLKKIGLREDVRFFLRVAGPIRPALKAEAESLLAQLEVRASKPADAKALNRIRDTYRIEKRGLVAAQRLARRIARAAERIAA